MSQIQKNCFWTTVDRNGQQVIVAICEACNSKRTVSAWFWNGKEKGYGNYNLKCNECNEILYEHKDSKKGDKE